MNSTRDGRKVYCVITDKSGNKVTSKTVTLSIRNEAEIKTQPKSVNVKVNATAKVTVKANGDGLKYTWYYKDKGASKFTKTTTFTSNTYTIEMKDSCDGRQIYCVVTDKYGNSVKSNTVTLKMK